MDRCTGGGGDDGDGPWVSGQGLFVGRVKQALGLELGFQLLKGHVQVSHPVRGQIGAVELVGSVPGEDGNLAQRQHLHAVFRAKPEADGAGLEHHAAQSAGGVL